MRESALPFSENSENQAMNPLRRLFLPLLALTLAAGHLIGPAHAQLETPQTLNAKATDLMKADKWAEALQVLTECTNRFDGTALTLYGPQFGVTWYRKGICELRLQKWDDAAKSFETCYQKYANKQDNAGSSNIFAKRALLQWGNAAMGGEDWETALRMFKKFLQERDKTRDKFEPGSFFINLAICHLKLNKIEEGVKHFETALKNKVEYRTPEAGIVAAFQALVDAVIEERDEKSLLAFVNENRSDIVIEPYDMPAYSTLFLALAGRAYQADMEASAFVLYQLIPSTKVMLQDVESRLARLGDRPGVVDGTRVIRRSELKNSQDMLEKQLASGDPNEVIQLAATGFIHESYGNVRGAYASYKQLELFYSKSKKREDHLYNLVRTASVIGEVMETEKYGMLFLKTFPDSKHVPAVRRLMLTSLFYSGEYVKCIEIASEMLPRLKEGETEHDICLHVLGGSYYYTGSYKEAQPLLDQHVELYPESKFDQAALYFQASNLSRLQFWSKSAKLLDAFLEKFPNPAENIYFPFALYDRANCHYALDEFEAALDKLNRLETEFPNSEVIDMAYNLKGNVLQNENEDAEAEKYYLKALELAERRGNDIVAGEALNYLVAMLGEKPKKKDDPNRMKDAIPFADKFWAEYPDSPYKAQVAVAQIHAMQSVGRGEEALNRLRDVIADLATTPGAVGMEEAIGSYTEAYLENHTPEQLKEHYYNFPKITASNRAARALLRIAIIGVYEDQLKSAETDQEKINAEAGIKVIFQDLKRDFDLKDLSNFILVRVGDFIRDTNTPREALDYYKEALSRDDKSYRFPALFGRAAVLAQGSAAEKKEAIADFQRILKDSQDRADKDRALYQLIVTQMEVGDHKEAKDNARLYLDREKGYSSKKPEVAMLLGEAYDKLGMTEDALASFINTANTYPGALRISAPATKRAMEIFWKRDGTAANGVPDRQGAYNLGRSYIDRTRRIVTGEDVKATAEEVEQWKEVERLVEQYVASPEVKSKEQLAEEAR